MKNLKPGAFVLMLLIVASVKMHGQDFKIIIPNPDIMGDIGNDGDMDIVGPNTYSKESKILILENNASAGTR